MDFTANEGGGSLRPRGVGHQIFAVCLMMQLCFRLANLALPVEKAAVQQERARAQRADCG